MSTTTNKLAEYLKHNKFMAATIVTGAVALVAIAGVMAWDGGASSAAPTQKPAGQTSQQADNKTQKQGESQVATTAGQSAQTGSVLGDSIDLTTTTKPQVQTAAAQVSNGNDVTPPSVESDTPVVETPGNSSNEVTPPSNPQQPGSGTQDPQQPQQPADPGQQPGGGTTTPVDPTPQGTGFTGGRVSLTFDDGVTSIWQNALPLLHQYGFKSTQYLISDTLTNNANYTGYMTADQAKQFFSADTGVVGTELAAHTLYHCDLTNQQSDDLANCPLGLSTDELAAKNTSDLSVSKANLQAMFPGFSFNDLASPYGAYNDATIAEIKATNYTSHRSTDDGFNVYGQLDAYNILVQNVEKTTTVAQVQAWVDQAKATNTWLVLVYHDVADTSAGTVVGDYGVSKADLQAQFEYIKSTGIQVVTVGEALAENAQAGTAAPVAPATTETVVATDDNGDATAPATDVVATDQPADDQTTAQVVTTDEQPAAEAPVQL
jgi:peptidoglycan/xylan/chitin deacetylase (PgdA/CDA1 family)